MARGGTVCQGLNPMLVRQPKVNEDSPGNIERKKDHAGAAYGGDHNQIITDGGAVSGIAMSRNGKVVQNAQQQPAFHRNIVPEQPPPTPPQVNNQRTPATGGLQGTPVALLSPNGSGDAGSVVSGTTMAQTPQPTLVGTPPAAPQASTPATPGPSSNNTPSTAATTPTDAPISSSPMAQGQPGQNPAPTATSGLSEFPGVVLKPGALIPDAILAEEGKKSKKKKKSKFNLFRKLKFCFCCTL